MQLDDPQEGRVQCVLHSGGGVRAAGRVRSTVLPGYVSHCESRLMLPCFCLSICYLSRYYRHVIDNIAVDTMAAGAAYSVVTTRGGSGWAFGAGNVGQIGLGTLVRATLSLCSSQPTLADGKCRVLCLCGLICVVACWTETALGAAGRAHGPSHQRGSCQQCLPVSLRGR